MTCFDDHRDPAAVEYPLRVLLGQRVLGMALGHEDLIDHEQLRYDELLAAMLGRLQSGRKDCELLAGKSTLNRLELFEDQGASRYKGICLDEKRIERLFVDLFIQAYPKPPREISLDLGTTDDPRHGQQGGAVLSRLLRLLLLPAAVHLLRKRPVIYILNAT